MIACHYLSRLCSWFIVSLYQLIKYLINGRLLSLLLVNDSSSDTTSHCARKDWNIPRGYYHKIKARIKGKVWTRGNCAASIDILPDDVLLDMFDFCRIDELPLQLWMFTWKWDVLAHVCRRWRQLIFASPRRLHIQLCCTLRTPVRKYLSCWPAFPIIVDYGDEWILTPSDEDNVFAALAHSNRVCALELAVTTDTELEKLVTAMQRPYPALKRLVLTSGLHTNMHSLPDRFLGGSAPCLWELELGAIPFPALPALLSSATSLVKLHLDDIPKSGRIAPDAMVAGLAGLTSLRSLHIKLRTDELHPYQPALLGRIHLLSRTILPALHCLVFGGEFEYSEDLVAQIDTPQLNTLAVYYSSHQGVIYNLPQLSAFINRSANLKQILSRKCRMMFEKDNEVSLRIGSATSGKAGQWDPETEPGISVEIPHVSQVAQVLSWIFPVVPGIVHLTMDSVFFLSEQAYRNSAEWPRILRQFSSIQTLLVFRKTSYFISNVLKNVARERFTLPALGLLCLEDRSPSSVEFITLRQECGRPVTFVRTKDKFAKRLMSYP